MMRKDTGAPRGSPPSRPHRVPLAVLMILAFLLGALASAPGAAADAPAGAPATRSAGLPPAVKSGYDGSEKKAKREAERGQPRRTARSSVGVPLHTGRQLPPRHGGPVAPCAALASGAAAPGSSAKAAVRSVPLPVLHCVFLC
ncbi:hypothetical protein [Streptomyces kronopolitis]|uniref:hypothetical protein n=1 Tax=Streptomyces kronopolitis TaxID=1612435 RepID=UPI003D971D45